MNQAGSSSQHHIIMGFTVTAACASWPWHDDHKQKLCVFGTNHQVGVLIMFACWVQVATAIRGAIIQAKMTCIPVRRGYWGNKIGKPHTVPTKVTGKCGSVTVRLIPAPRGAGIVAARVPKKVLQMAGIDDCYTASRGSTKTLGNFVKVNSASIPSTCT